VTASELIYRYVECKTVTRKGWNL